MRYGVLFEVEILHDYFLNLGERVHEALNDDLRDALQRRYSAGACLSAFPTERTENTLSGHRMIFKPTARGFLVGVALDPTVPDDRPAVPPGPGFRLVFALRTVDPYFSNYTALAVSAPAFYRFGNDSGNEIAGRIFLSTPIPDYDTTRSYEAGEVYAESSGAGVDLFRAIRDTGPAAAPLENDWERIPPDTFETTVSYPAGSIVLSANRLFRALVDGPGTDLDNAAEWQPLGHLANQYVTTADSLVLRPPRFNLDLSSAALSQASIRLLRPDATTPIREQVFDAETGNLDMVPLDLHELASGAYRLEVLDAALNAVPGLGFDFYLDGHAVRGAWLGVIEIAAGSDGSALLDAFGGLRSPRYTIRFLNRATRWRYIFPTAQPVGNGADVAPEDGDNHMLVTTLPRPLTRFGAGLRLQADDPATPTVSEEVRLPEPQARRIRRQNAQWYSEIHVSNLPL